MDAMGKALENYGERLLQALREAVGEDVAKRQALLELVALGAAHYGDLDRSAQHLLGRVGELLMEQFSVTVETLPSSAEQRALQRQLNLAKGIHYTADRILGSLEHAPLELPDFARDGDVLALATIQDVIDLIHDINQQVTSGNDIL